MIQRLNYHHLMYFWTVARLGSIARACKELELTQPAISAQIRTLERAIGEPLFQRKGRNLVLTDVGRVVYRYADEIFTLGRELTETLAGNPTDGPVRLVVGMADLVPKLIAHKLLAPALHLATPVRLVLNEGKHERLLAALAAHELDLVVTDTPVDASVNVRAFNHPLGESGVTVFAAQSLPMPKRGFPQWLDRAPFVMPGHGTMLRRALDAWFHDQGVRPTVVAEIEDSAVVKVFGEAGAGYFVAPTAIEADVRRQYGVRVAGRIPEVRVAYYLISVEKRLKNTDAIAIIAAAREEIFG